MDVGSVFGEVSGIVEVSMTVVVVVVGSGVIVTMGVVVFVVGGCCVLPFGNGLEINVQVQLSTAKLIYGIVRLKFVVLLLHFGTHSA